MLVLILFDECNLNYFFIFYLKSLSFTWIILSYTGKMSSSTGTNNGNTASTSTTISPWLDSLLSVSATTFLGPLMYTIPGPYVSSSNLHLNHHWEVFSLESWIQFFIIIICIKILIVCPKMMLLNSFQVSTITKQFLINSCCIIPLTSSYPQRILGEIATEKNMYVAVGGNYDDGCHDGTLI